MSAIVRNNAAIRASSAVIRGNRNKIIGHNNIVYGDSNMGVGNNNRVYGDYNRWKGNLNVLQGVGPKVMGKDNKVGQAAIMENRKRARACDSSTASDKGKEEDDDDDDNDADTMINMLDAGDGEGNVFDVMTALSEGRGHEISTERLVAMSNMSILPVSVRAAFSQLVSERNMGHGAILGGDGGGDGKMMRVPTQDKERVDEEADEEAGDPVCLACGVNKRKTTNVPADDETGECGHHSYCVECARRAYSGKLVGSTEARCPECRAQLSRVLMSFVN